MLDMQRDTYTNIKTGGQTDRLNRQTYIQSMNSQTNAGSNRFDRQTDNRETGTERQTDGLSNIQRDGQTDT